MELKQKNTRFRAYQLGNEGSSFSYFDGTYFTLIEARLNETNTPSLVQEIEKCNVKNNIDTLHITSWDEDHCKKGELEIILRVLKPKRIEYPGYLPHTDNGTECFKMIKAYTGNIVAITQNYVSHLTSAQSWGYSNILYNNQKDYPESNNNSSIKLFRAGCFSVLSLGDVESKEIANFLIKHTSILNEVDVMILAHHGADNGFTTDEFIKKVNPSVAVCSSNYDNQYDHNPRQEIKDILYNNEVKLYTTKTGDVVIRSNGDHTISYEAINLISNSTKVSSESGTLSTKRHNHFIEQILDF